MSVRERISDWLWPPSLLLRQWFRAAFQTAGITVTVLAAALSIVPLLLPKSILDLFDDIREPPWQPILVGLVILFAGGLLVLLSGFFALWAADPETYARLRLSGRPAKEMLYTVSREIRRICRQALSSRKQIDDLLSELGAAPDTPFSPEVHNWIYECWADVQLLIQKQHKRLARTEAMKLLISRELDIPPRRICDHLFQFSPAVYRDRLQKFGDNWAEILALGKKHDLNGRIQEAVIRNRSFLANVKRRIDYQDEILRNRDLHQFVVQFASMHSSSGSLQTYAKALTFVAETGSRSLQRNRRNPGRAKQEVVERLLFLQRKQRAHPGFDLHDLLERSVSRMNRPSVKPWLTFLNDLVETQKPGRRLRGELASKIQEEELKELCSLPLELSNLVSNSRDEICNHFGKICDAWFNDNSGQHYIVSHGYSKTVLSVIKSTLKQKRERAPHLFFVLHERKEEALERLDSLDSRIMEYEIKEDEELRPLCNLAAGSDHHLLELLSPGGSVLIVIGAESFDKDRKVVHPRGIGDGLDHLLSRLYDRGMSPLVAVVAEDYKKMSGPLSDHATFYRQHFDRIDLYPPTCIHLIITDQGTFPSTWEATLEERRRALDPPLS